MSNKVIEIVTERILNHLENGVKPWAKPWQTITFGPFHHNHKTGSQYSGINTLTLWATQEEYGYKTNRWMTAKQAQEQGGFIRKGEKGTPILWAAPYCKEHGKNGCPDDCETGAMAWRYYTVFNLDQTEGIEYQQAQPKVKTQVEVIAEAEAIFQASKAELKIGGGRAYCSRATGHIQMPEKTDFLHTEGWYSTLLHELTHWTGHKGRLDREFGKRFGDQAYAFEELVAEIGSAFLCAHVGLPTTLENHASYIDHWKRIIKDRPSALVEAASKASKAYEYLLKLAESNGSDVQPKIPAAAPAPQPVPVVTRQPQPVAVPAVSAPDKTELKKKHGVAPDARQELLNQLALYYITATPETEDTTISLQYGTTIYNIKHHKGALERLFKALGFSKQLKELAA